MILVDTNILVAVANSRDSHHEAARDLLETGPEELLVSPGVIAELCYLLSERAGPSAEARTLRAFGAGELRPAELTRADLALMADLTERYADLGLGRERHATNTSASARRSRVSHR